METPNSILITSLESLKELNPIQKDSILNSVQKLEKKIFPKNEQMDILIEVKKRTNTLILALSSTSNELNSILVKGKENTNDQNKLKNNKKKNKSNINNISKKETFKISKNNNYTVLGYLIYSKKDSIIKFAVDPSKRNQGTGWKLLSYSLERMTNQMPKEHKINLAVDVSRLPAQHLYTKAGFKVKEQINDYYELGRHAFIMEYII